MPDRNVRTNLRISAETKGFDEAQRKASGINQLVSESLAQQAKGFADAEKQGMAFQRAVGRLQKTFGDSSTAMKAQIEGVMANFDALGAMDFKEVQTHIGALENGLQELAREQLAVSDVMERTADKTSDAYKNLKNHMKELNDESMRITSTISSLNRAFSDQTRAAKESAQEQEAATRMSQGSFTQGFLQAALPWPAAFLQRGPGMRRQMMGMMTGGIVRAGAAGLGAAFTGVQGLQRGAASIPLAGGFISGQLGSATGYAQQALEWQQMRRDLLPLLGSGFGASTGLRQAEQRLRSFERRQRRTEPYVSVPTEFQTQENVNAPGAVWLPGGRVLIPMKSDVGREIAQNIRSSQRKLDIVARPTGDFSRYVSPREEVERRRDVENERRRLRQDIVRQRRTTPFGQLLEQGRGLGLNRMELMQRISPILQLGGGGLGEAAGQGLTQAALAVQTLFGVGPEVSGAFLRAGRRGGLVGGQGQAGQALVEAIQGARELGLERSEVPQYLQIIANGIQQWQITGIPVNEGSLRTIALEVEKAGISAPRALQISQGIQQYVQNIGARGIRGGLDILLLRQLGGFRGGGAEDLEQAMIRMETMQGELAGGVEGLGPESKLGQALQVLMRGAGGGPVGQRRFLGSILKSMGAQTSTLEMRALAGRLTGEELLTPEQREMLERDRERRRVGAQEAVMIQDPRSLMEMATKQVARVSPHLEKQAGLLEKQLEVGNRMVTAVTRLERSALQTTNAFTQLVEEPLRKFSGALEKLTGKLEKLTAGPDVLGSIASSFGL